MKNTTPQIKVCGLTRMDQVSQLIPMGIDYLGFIFYPKSPRYVLNRLSTDELRTIDFPRKTGVFVNESLETILKLAEDCGLNLIQLHGDETADFLLNLKREKTDLKLIKVLRIGRGEQAETLQDRINAFQNVCDFFLFDTDSKSYGGTGDSFDWQLLNHVEIPKKWFLSGGLSLQNLNKIKTLHPLPDVLDVNSKFERSPGDKNLTLIEELLTEIKRIP